MERVKTLVRKLQQKIDEGCSVENLLLTVNLLQSELLQESHHSEKIDEYQGVHIVAPQSVIAIVEDAIVSPPVPVSLSLPEEIPDESTVEDTYVPEEDNALETVEEEDHPEKVVEEEVKKEKIIFELAPMDDLEMSEEFEYPEDEDFASEEIDDTEKDVIEVEEDSAVSEPENVQEAFDPMEEVPTLFQQSDKPLIKRMQQSSLAFPEDLPQHNELNDILNQQQSELGDKLKESPIKDLRKAIGVNDRYLFINELFRGDESEFKRSIKTIQNFSILPEAEYWIRRELKIKLGWDNENPLVKQFDSLVKRRFS